MDILAALPGTHAGRITRRVWTRMLAMAGGAPPPDPVELAEHFATSVLEQVPSDQLIAHFAHLAPMMARVNRLVEEESSDERYVALLGLPDSWLRYACSAQHDEPLLLLESSYLPALDPASYSDRPVQREGRHVRIRDFGGSGPLMLLWHGAGGDRTHWETFAPHLAGFHVVAQDLPGHGRSPLDAFTTGDALADADAVVAELDEGPPVVVGHSLGGYLALRYAATRNCRGWIGLDGPPGLVCSWDSGDPGSSHGVPEGLREAYLQIGREIRGFDVAGDFAAMNCPAMLLLCAVAASPIEQSMVSGRRELAEHVARRHPEIIIQWVQTGHDTIVSHQPQETAALIRDFLGQPRPPV